MCCPRSRDGSIKTHPVAEARVTASVFDLSSVDVSDGVYVEKNGQVTYSTVPSSQLRRTPRLTTSPRLVLPVALLELQHG